jgi:hypothetical protein
MLVTFTDSGTEALRLICSSSSPHTVLIGTSLVDLPFHVVWYKAVQLDPGWRRRMIAIDERGPGSPPPTWPSGMARWRREDSVDRLIATIEQVATA